MLSEAQRALIAAHLRRSRVDTHAGGADGDAAPRRASTPIVELTSGESEGSPRLFMVHAIGGTVHSYAPLAALLADDFKVNGIQAAGLAPDSAPAVSLDAMAAAYLAAIRSGQPEGGPYRIAGWSMGGLVAYELARRLEEDGEKVSALILLNAPFAVPALPAAAPSAPDDRTSDSRIAAWFVADAARTLGWTGEPPDAPDPAAGSAAEQLDWLARRLDAGPGAPKAASGLADAVRAEIDRRFTVFQAHTRLIAGFRPRAALRTRTLLVSARRSPNAAVAAQWLALLGPQAATLQTMDADHYTFLQAPLVTQVAARIRAWQGARWRAPAEPGRPGRPPHQTIEP